MEHCRLFRESLVIGTDGSGLNTALSNTRI